MNQTYVIQPGYAGEIVAEVEIELTDNQEVWELTGTLHNTILNVRLTKQLKLSWNLKLLMEIIG